MNSLAKKHYWGTEYGGSPLQNCPLKRFVITIVIVQPNTMVLGGRAKKLRDGQVVF